jgi:hypothetical protein
MRPFFLVCRLSTTSHGREGDAGVSSKTYYIIGLEHHLCDIIGVLSPLHWRDFISKYSQIEVRVST